MIDDTFRSVAATDEAEERDEGKKIIEELTKLKYEIDHDRALTYVDSCRYRQFEKPGNTD